MLQKTHRHLALPRLSVLAASLVIAGLGHAASTLTPGQVVVTSFSSADPDPVSFALLCNAAAGTSLTFTDNAFTNNALRTNEGSFSWTASRAVNAGEIITISAQAASPSISPEGTGSINKQGSYNIAAQDNLLVYQGESTDPQMLFGISHHSSNAGAWGFNSQSANNTSDLPAPLQNQITALALQQSSGNQAQDFNGTATGTAAELLAAITNPANWQSRSGSTTSVAPTNLTVSDAPDCADAGSGGGGTNPGTPSTPTDITRISAIQGNSTTSPLAGQEVRVSAIITAYLPGLSGFVLQEAIADQDSDITTSEGLFVYYGGTKPTEIDETAIGKRVEITGTVSEYVPGSGIAGRGQTQLGGTLKDVQIGAAVGQPDPVELLLPLASEDILERHEGMLVKICAADNKPLVVTDTYELGRYGNIVLSPEKRQVQFTEENAPDVAANQAYLAQARLNRIILDDAASAQNPATHVGRNGNPLSADNTLRAGDAVDCVTGILDQFSDNEKNAHEIDYRIQPTIAPIFTGEDRPTAEALQTQFADSNLKVTSVNVLNFFVKTSGSFTVPGTNTSHDVRGAEASVTIEQTAYTQEYQRQLDKLVHKLLALNADIYGLNEIQNDGYGSESALATLVNALNAQAGAGTYAYVGGSAAPITDGAKTLQALGTDAISVAIIYNTRTVEPVGNAAAPDVTDARYDAFTAAHGNRVPVAQTFKVKAVAEGSADELVTFAVNHFKSKGSVINNENDTNDGQGNNNPSRVKAAEQLSAWLATHPTGQANSHVILSGDFNAYSKEDPIRTLETAGYAQLDEPGDNYSYSFDGLWGSLDHILASNTLAGKANAIVEWAINAEEPTVLDYNYNYKKPAQLDSYYGDDFYRASDHNPILVGFALDTGTTPPIDPELAAEFKLDIPANGTTSPGSLSARITGGGNSCALAANTTPAIVAPDSTPPGVNFPYNLLQWELDGCTPNSTVTVTLDLPAPVPANAQYWKWGPTPQNQTPSWYTIPFTQTGPQQISFQITDEGLGDSALGQTGYIADPGGLGVTAATPGTNNVTPVPTLGTWALTLLGGLLAAFGASPLIRRRKI